MRLEVGQEVAEVEGRIVIGTAEATPEPQRPPDDVTAKLDPPPAPKAS